jgi:MFS transporter, SP family, general alpha glucoside:H+ symporter
MVLGKSNPNPNEYVGAGAETLTFSRKDIAGDAHRSNSIVIRNAKAATEKEHQMSLWQGIRLYPKAVAWSMLISLCIAMEGFDLCLLGTFCTSLHIFLA